MNFILLNAFIGIIAISLISAPLGSIILWRRMAYFGDSLSHAALLGITIAILCGLPQQIGGMIAAGGFALTYSLLRKNYSSDALLGIFAYGSLSLALIIANSFTHQRLDLNNYLFGDILLINQYDIFMLYIVAIIVICWFKFRFNDLLSIIISEDLALVEKIKVKLIDIEFILLLSLSVAVTLKMLGILLITALLIIPPATARYFSQGPDEMIYKSLIICLLSSFIGLVASYHFDMPASASIILLSVICFIISNIRIRL